VLNPWSYGTGGGGVFGFTPFDKGTKYSTGIFDYAKDVLKDKEKRWDGDVQVAYVLWTLEKTKTAGWTGVFGIRNKDKYWHYDPPSSAKLPSKLTFDAYTKLNTKEHGVTPTICAKLWLARYEVVDKYYPGRDLDLTIENHVKKAEELYKLFKEN